MRDPLVSQTIIRLSRANGQIEMPETDQPLREEVRQLGALVGEILAGQEHRIRRRRDYQRAGASP